jgi:NADH-quinone oxidoreductase subunit J
MILVIVYVGAGRGAVPVRGDDAGRGFRALREGFQRYAPIGAVVGGILFIELLLVLGAWTFAADAGDLRLSPAPAGVPTPRRWGGDLHGLHLSVPGGGPDPAGRDDRRHRADAARQADHTKRQDIAAQLARSSAVQMAQPGPGPGHPPRGDPAAAAAAGEEAPKQVEHGGHH